MALENLTGPNVFITNLVASNPTATDPLEQGDDHVRGVKNVLLNSLPNITAAMTRTAAQLNAATLPSDAIPLALAAVGAAGVSPNASRADHVHPGSSGPVAGDVVQMVARQDAGSSTSSTSLANLTGSAINWQSRYASSIVVVDVMFNAPNPYAAGQNCQANYQIMRDGLGDSYVYQQGSPSNAGGIGAINMGHVRYVYPANNLPAGAHTFTLGGYVSNGGVSAAATNQMWTITEIKV